MSPSTSWTASGAREEFPDFRIWRENACGLIRYIGGSLHQGLKPRQDLSNFTFLSPTTTATDCPAPTDRVNRN
jgi:hypothetical protein